MNTDIKPDISECGLLFTSCPNCRHTFELPSLHARICRDADEIKALVEALRDALDYVCDGIDEESQRVGDVIRAALARVRPAATEQTAQAEAGDEADDSVSESGIAEFQDDVRDMILGILEESEIPGDIDGGGCDSGDWRDFTLDEIRQGFNRVLDHYFEKDQAREAETVELRTDYSACEAECSALKAQLATQPAPAAEHPAVVPEGHCTCNDPLALGIVHRDPEDGPCFVYQEPTSVAAEPTVVVALQGAVAAWDSLISYRAAVEIGALEKNKRHDLMQWSELATAMDKAKQALLAGSGGGQ